MTRIMPLITPISVVIGVLLANHLEDYTFLVPWIFAFITFTGSLGSNFASLGKVATHPFPVFTVLVILHILMPLWAWGLGLIAFNGDDLTILGLVLGMVIPTGVTSMIWVTIYKGNSALALTIILLDTFLSPFIVPYSIAFFGGGTIDIEMWPMVQGLLGMIVIPSLIAMILNQSSHGRIPQKLSPMLAPFSKLCVGAVVILNSSKISAYLTDWNPKLLLTAVIVLLTAASGYGFSWLIARLLNWKKEETISLTFTGGMRNISAGAVIATTYFPAAVAVPVVLSMLFQQMLASIFGHFLDRHYRKDYLKI